MPASVRSVPLLLLGGLIAAEELRVRDVRVAIGAGPAVTESEARSVERGVAVDATVGWSGSNIHRGGGFAWSAGIAYASGESDVRGGQPTTLDYRRVGPFARLAYAYAFTPWLHAEGGGFLGVGSLRLETDRNGGPTSSASGYHLAIGPYLATYAEVGAGIVVGLEIEYRSEGGVVIGDDADLFLVGDTVRARGVAARAAVGYRF